ncbi:hypothetical protein [Tritonibacter horizontis]|uniref:Uncharacterized protein n=1 Tax=Tritonibacter horizontis TaxID=1768241 RepID=A0A132BYK7_9RHOB|nr:hypothetical protein [Tritonibacter horizontis]KUP93266.1 hypothetical protein TRIHO_18670 [Tritonibacter horizontis]
MSEPVTHAEIEDVLSSIRRLVRETDRSEEGRQMAAKVAKPATRLVLTPALRVQGDETTSPQAAVERADRDRRAPVVMDQLVGDAAQDALSETDARVEDVEAVAASMTSGADRATSDVADTGLDTGSASDTASPDAGIPVDTAARSAEPKVFSSQEATRILASALQAAPNASDPVTGEADADLPPEDTAGPPLETADPQSAVTAPDDAPWRDPAARLYDVLATENAPAAPAAADQPEPDQSHADQPDAEAQSASAPAPREQSSRVAAVVRRIAELETAGRIEANARAALNGSFVSDVNEDEIEAVPPSGPAVETIQWEDHILQDDGAEAAAPLDAPDEPVRSGAGTPAASQDKPEAAALDALEAEEGFLDEESLRALVADIVREELQGALGERITRNVRKLVRREIQRALAAQDLL